jgi:hypothetical protein
MACKFSFSRIVNSSILFRDFSDSEEMNSSSLFCRVRKKVNRALSLGSGACNTVERKEEMRRERERERES